MRPIVAALLVLLGARAAGAEVVTVDCPGLDADAVRAALVAERLETTGEAPPVRVSCPDADTAVVTIVASAGEPLERRVDLRDVPASLRPRLVALAIAEGLAVVAARRPPPPATRPPIAETPAETPATAPPPAAPPEPPARLVAPARASAWQVAPAVGLRTYAPAWRPLALVAVEAGRGRLSLGLAFATEEATAVLGDVRLAVLTAGLGLTLGCAGTRARLCAGARVDAGVALASGDPLKPGISGAGAGAPYGALLGRATLAFPAGGAPAFVLLEAGWSEGLVALADDQEVTRAAGFTVALALGVRLWP